MMLYKMKKNQNNQNNTRIPIYLAGAYGDLRDIPLGKSVAIMTGSYDPAHQGHLDAAQKTLTFAEILTGSPIELVLLQPHSYSPGKSPAPLEVRIEIIQTILQNYPQIGVMDSSALKGAADKSIKEFFIALSQYRSLEYSRIIGSDYISKAPLESPSITHFVNVREERILELPPHFFALPYSVPTISSSTKIRAGEVELGEEYLAVAHHLKEYYPLAGIKSL